MNREELFIGGRVDGLLENIRDKKNTAVFGMPFFSRAIALAGLERFLYVCPDFIKAGEMVAQLKSIRDDVVYLPAADDVLSTARQGSETAAQRLVALGRLADGTANVAVTTALGYIQLYPKKSDVLKNIVTLKEGESADTETLVELLAAAGYKRTGQTEAAGEFAMRGDILDIAPVGAESGVRIDFFGDRIEQIRAMDLGTQLSQGRLDSISIYPNTEIFLPPDTRALIQKLYESVPKNLEPEYLARAKAVTGELAAKLENGDPTGLTAIKALLGQQPLDAFFDAPIIFDESKHCVDNFNAHLSEHRSRLKTLLARGEAFNFSINQLRDNFSSTHTMVSFDKILCQNRIFSPAAVLNFKDAELTSYAKTLAALPGDIRMWQSRGITVTVFAKEPFKSNLINLFRESDVSVSVVREGTLLRGGCFFDEKRIFIGHGDLAAKRATPKVKTRKDTFFTPKVGEYVVHHVHGIGLCEGLKRMEIDGTGRDFCVIRYEGGDKVYVSVENLDVISGYAGEDAPVLNKIGGAEFARIKEKVKKSIKEMAFDLSRLYAERESLTGHAYGASNASLAEFEAEFPYEETPCQLKAVEEGLEDLTKGKIMDRLLCGDVGYGKTEVAMRLMYKVVLEGKQAAFISPTTILASQHYRTLKKRMEPFGVTIGALTRFEPAASVKKTLDGLSSGKVDIVCGTHRTLSKDVRFADLGLLVLDEEQRFGVADKEKIKLLKADVNVLSLSATPIPRTLHMAMSGIRDISVLNTPPPSRIPVATYVTEYSEPLVFDAITREAGRGGQSFIVYNRVETIDAYAATIIKIFPDLKIAVVHGQMPKQALENTIGEFINGKIDILITSAIIENGIDMANVNTMIVVDSDMFGLSQLYQLRGRIGRGDRLAYAFFTYDGGKTLTENAYKRLDAITSYTEFGSGFKLAMRDLEIRGAGNILGREQHGHMTKVGYDMYLKLIGEVMDEIKGKKSLEDKEVKVAMDFDAFIPDNYIPDTAWRLKAYKRCASIETEDERAAALKEFEDVYGPVPESLMSLATAALIKNLVKALGGEKAVLTAGECKIKFSSPDIPLELIKRAITEGFLYSAAESSLSLKDKNPVKGQGARAPLIKRFLRFLLTPA